MDVSVKGLEPEVVARLAEQAEREGVSAQEWMRQALRRTASLLTPRELSDRVAARTPVSEDRYQAAMETVKARRSAKTSTANAMYATAVADSGGLLTAAGIVEGLRHEVVEYVALDAATLLLAEFLVVLHEGRPARAAVDHAELERLVREWFPVRALAIDAALRAPAETGDVDTWAALALAEMLGIPLVTKHAEVTSRKIPVLHS